MSRKGPRAFFGALALASIAAVLVLVVHTTPGSQAALLAAPTPISTDLPRREISGETKSPDISFIDSPSATCYRPAVGTGACFIQWDYLYVTAASGSYIISMTVTIDGRIRAYHSGFFQSWMYIPAEMTDPGYKVACGAPVGGDPASWGNSYSYVLRARETSGLSAANYGTVRCPADMSTIYLPLTRKQ